MAKSPDFLRTQLLPPYLKHHPALPLLGCKDLDMAGISIVDSVNSMMSTISQSNDDKGEVIVQIVIKEQELLINSSFYFTRSQTQVLCQHYLTWRNL